MCVSDKIKLKNLIIFPLGGWYTFSCKHGFIYGSKLLFLSESVRKWFSKQKTIKFSIKWMRHSPIFLILLFTKPPNSIALVRTLIENSIIFYLNPSQRDAADLWLSFKIKPPVTIVDTPCTLGKPKQCFRFQNHIYEI